MVPAIHAGLMHSNVGIHQLEYLVTNTQRCDDLYFVTSASTTNLTDCASSAVFFHFDATFLLVLALLLEIAIHFSTILVTSNGFDAV